MKKTIFLICTLLLSSLSFAQKIQIKKDKILYDKAEIAIISEPYRNHYDFSTLSGEKKFSVDFKGLSVNDTQFYQWLEVTSADGKTKTEIPHDVLITAFDVKRIIAHNLSVKYNLLDASGINDKALATFFETQREILSDKYGKTDLGDGSGWPGRARAAGTFESEVHPRAAPEQERHQVAQGQRRDGVLRLPPSRPERRVHGTGDHGVALRELPPAQVRSGRSDP